MHHPPELLSTDRVVLRRPALADALLVAETLARNIEHLTGWMAWAPTAAVTEDAQREQLAAVLESWDAGTEYRYLILDPDEERLLGLASLHRRIGPRALEIGYWVSVDHLRRGYATEAARVLTGAALALPDVDRVEIRCDEANTASAAVPRRLGYRLVRVDPKPPAAPLETGRNLVWATP